MRKLLFICAGLWLCGWLAGIARADTYQLNDGQTLTGDIISFNENGLIVRTADDKYSDRVPWTDFSQADLKKLGENAKIAPLVEPFIEVSQEERLKKTEVKINEVPRLERPAAQSLLGAMFSSGLGVFLLLVLYAANIYAAAEVAIFRARPVPLVCGVAAVLPLIGPIIFLSLPTLLQQTTQDAAAEAQANLPAQTFVVANPLAPEVPAEPPPGSGLRLAHTEAAHVAAGLPQTQVFARGAFTFNRRFFETKFPGFFGVVRRDAEKDMVLEIKAARGHYVATRISRITGNDMHLQVNKGQASEEVMIPFSEIQEIQLKHKDA